MTTSPRTVKTAMATLFNADADLTSVTFHTSVKPLTDLTPDYVVLGNIEGDDSAYHMGSGQLSTYTIECSAMLRSATADAAFDRAWEVKDAIAQVLAANHTVTSNVLDAQLGRWEINEGIDPNDGRLVALEFQIEVRDSNE